MKRTNGASVTTIQAHHATTAADNPARRGHRYRVISSRIAPSPGPGRSRSWQSRGRDPGVDAAEPTVTGPPAGQERRPRRQGGQRGEPPGGGVRGHPLRRAQDAIRPAVPVDQAPVVGEGLFQAQGPIEHAPYELAALAPEVERGTD